MFHDALTWGRCHEAALLRGSYIQLEVQGKCVQIRVFAFCKNLTPCFLCLVLVPSETECPHIAISRLRTRSACLAEWRPYEERGPQFLWGFLLHAESGNLEDTCALYCEATNNGIIRFGWKTTKAPPTRLMLFDAADNAKLPMYSARRSGTESSSTAQTSMEPASLPLPAQNPQDNCALSTVAA